MVEVADQHPTRGVQRGQRAGRAKLIAKSSPVIARHTARETAPLNITLSIREPHRTAMIDTAASMAAYSE